MKKDNILELFKRPIEWRDYCDELDPLYTDNVFNSNEIEVKSKTLTFALKSKKHELQGTLADVESFDRITGFAPILREFTKRQRQANDNKLAVEPSLLRNIFLKNNPSKKIRLLSFNDEGIVGLTEANRVIMKPTLVSQWVSIMANQREYSVDQSFDQKFFTPYKFSGMISASPDLNLDFDEIKYKVGFNYSPSDLKKMSLHSFILRTICSNGSQTIDKNWQWSVPNNHDNGAWRTKLETVIARQFTEKNTLKEWIEALSEKRINNIEEHAPNWSYWKKLPLDFQNAILSEYAEKNMNQSAFDFFNAITAARKRIDLENEDSVHRMLAPLAGHYMEEQVGTSSARVKLNELLHEAI